MIVVIGLAGAGVNACVLALAGAVARRRGMRALHVTLFAACSAAASLMFVIQPGINAFAGAQFGGPSACTAQGFVNICLGSAYLACLLFQAHRAYRHVVRGVAVSNREAAVFHAVAWSCIALLSVLIAVAPGRSAPVRSGAYCFPTFTPPMSPVSVASFAIVVVATAVPLQIAYACVWAHVRDVTRAARSLRAAPSVSSRALVAADATDVRARAGTAERVGGTGFLRRLVPSRRSASPPELARVKLRLSVLVALFCLSYLPYTALLVIQAVTGSAAPAALDALSVTALAVSCGVNTALVVWWSAAFRRQAAAWWADAASLVPTVRAAVSHWRGIGAARVAPDEAAAPRRRAVASAALSVRLSGGGPVLTPAAEACSYAARVRRMGGSPQLCGPDGSSESLHAPREGAAAALAGEDAAQAAMAPATATTTTREG